MSTDTGGWITDDNGTELVVGQRAIWCRGCEVWWPCTCDERVVDRHATTETVGAAGRPVFKEGHDSDCSEGEDDADSQGVVPA